MLVEKLKKARDEKRTITCFIGAHVIKCGLSRYLIWLMENGYITHLASNGAGSIHDFELAYLGGTSEHVPTAIEDGSFGMWEETGRWMNEAIREGRRARLWLWPEPGRLISTRIRSVFPISRTACSTAPFRWACR